MTEAFPQSVAMDRAMQEPLDQISERLKGLTREGGSIEAAQVKVIGLDTVREAAGPRWARMRERVRMGSLSIINRMLGPDDMAIPAGDGFLVILAEGGAPDETARRSQEIEQALLAFYLGDEAMAMLQPEVTRTPLNAEALTNLLAEAGPKAPERLVARALPGEVGFTPIYLPHEDRIGALIAAPVRAENGRRRPCYNPAFLGAALHGEETPDYLELDLAVLDAAVAASRRFIAAGRSHVIGLSVHSTTMRTRRSREAYLAWLGEVDPAIRRRLFALVAEIERGTPMIAITEWCTALRARVSRVALDFHLADHAIGGIGGTRAWAASICLPVSAGQGRGARAEQLRQHLITWRKMLAPQGVRLIAYGIEDSFFLDAAAAEGAQMLASDSHWPVVSTPEHAFETMLAAAR